MNRTITAAISAAPGRVLEIISDLTTYPHWLELVTEALPCPTATDFEELPAWLITLRAKIGPFARSKRLRMGRTRRRAMPNGEGEAIFERRELDARDHSSWVMQVTVRDRGDPDPNQSEIEISLKYGGSLWSGALETVLGSVVGSAGKKLSLFAANTG